LLSKEDWRAALTDEIEPCRGKVSLVVVSSPLSRCGERLAGGRPSPERLVCWYSCKLKGVGPSSDSREEVTLCVSIEFLWFDLSDAPFVNIALRQ